MKPPSALLKIKEHKDGYRPIPADVGISLPLGNVACSVATSCCLLVTSFISLQFCTSLVKPGAPPSQVVNQQGPQSTHPKFRMQLDFCGLPTFHYHFNPRIRRSGCDPFKYRPTRAINIFQSAHPKFRMRPSPCHTPANQDTFQSTHPKFRMRLLGQSHQGLMLTHFNPRTRSSGCDRVKFIR